MAPRAFLAAMLLLAGCSVASAQDATIGAGKLEIGGFPWRRHVLRRWGRQQGSELQRLHRRRRIDLLPQRRRWRSKASSRAASAGRRTCIFNNTKLIHNQMPTVWSYSGNVVFFPGGTAGKRAPILYHRRHRRRRRCRPACRQKCSATTSTLSARRCSSPRTSAAASSCSAAPTRRTGASASTTAICSSTRTATRPQFFAQSKSRGAHRVYVGMLYTWKR